MANIEEIKKRIAKLMQMTVDNGASETEANHAFATASRLMSEYNLSFSDISSAKAHVESLRYGARRINLIDMSNGDKKRLFWPEVSHGLSNIADFWQCTVFRDLDKGDAVFFGTEFDTLQAVSMVAIVRNTMESEFKRYMESPARPRGVHGRALRPSFMVGMITRINQRLESLVDERLAAERAANPAQGGALVVLAKNQIVAQRFDQYQQQKGLNLQPGKQTKHKLRADALQHGVKAGDNVALGNEKQIGTQQRIGD